VSRIRCPVPCRHSLQAKRRKRRAVEVTVNLQGLLAAPLGAITLHVPHGKWDTHLARQERPGVKRVSTFALKGQKSYKQGDASNNSFALTGRGLRRLLPRAMPWADICWPFRPLFRIIDFTNLFLYVYPHVSD